MKFYVFLLTIFLSTHTTKAQSLISDLSSSLYFSENPIHFDPSLIKKNSITYMPVRALVNFFDGSIHQSKLTLAYTIKIQKKQFQINQNANSYTLNGQPKTFSKKPFMHKTRLYVPMKEFLRELDFDVIEKNGHFYADSIAAPSPSTNTPSSSEFFPLNYTHSETHPPTKMILPISNKTYPLESKSFNGINKTNLTPFISHLGYTIEFFDHHMLLKKNNRIYSFKHGSRLVKISDKRNIITKKLSYSPHFINQKFYVELDPFLNDLGFDYHRSANSITILKKLNNITVNPNGSIQLSKNSQIQIKNGNKLKNPNRIYWDLATTKCPNTNVNLNLNSVKTIVFGQNNTTCRMVFYMNTPYSVQANRINKQTTEFSFQKIKAPQKSDISKKYLPSNSIKGKIIIIDPGHGGSDPGAVTRHNDYEKNYTLDISRRIKSELEKMGATAILLRTKDTNPTLYQRVKKINRIKGDFLISVHVNSFINQQANGSETYYYKKGEKRAAKYVQNEFVKTLKLKNNGIKYAKMYILKYSKIPGILIEPCFITNPIEYKKLKTTDFRDKIAIATARGLNEYYKTYDE
jgi:N-acetylmuramoyl-L-alanine amidase CwlD